MKKFILRLLPWVIVAALLAVFVIFIGIPLFAEEEVVHKYDPTVYYYEGDNKALTLENDYLSFELDPSNTHFKVVEKATGREWLSNPADAASDSLAVSANKELLDATVIVTYSTASGTVDFNNFKYSIENQNYNITKQDDSSVRVDYAIGKIEKTYLIPTAITAERFKGFLDSMSKSTQKKLTSNYTLYEPEKLDSKKNKDEIIALYPSVVDQALYILKSDTSENNKKKIEGYFAEVNYSQEDFEIDQQLVAGAKDNSGPVFNVTLIYRLEGNDLVVEVPYSEIRYRADYPITYVTPLPMFGAAGLEDEGFMLVPEGGGALINFNNGKLQQNSYYANMYGWDYGVVRKEMVNETRLSFPVFGMSKNGGSFLCMLEGATSFGGIQADISMRYNSYNWLCAKYNVIHADQYNVSAKTAQLVYMFEQSVPEETVIQRYRFIDSGSYVDMANAYGDYLREKNPELAASASSEDMPVSVELVGAIDKTVVKFGLPIESVFTTTPFEDAEKIMLDLASKGVTNLNIRFSGWANGGITQEVFTKVNILRELGGKNAMKKLIETAKSNNIPLYFDGINCFVYNSGVLEGFVAFTDAARYTTREQIKLYPYDIVTYQPSEWLDPYYVARPEYAKKNTDNMIAALSDIGAAGVSFRDIGYLLSADYNPKATVTREQVKAMNVQSLKDALASGKSVMIKNGNDYAVPYATLITDMELDGTLYSILDQNVPFYQIALHGLKDYTGQPLNLSGNYMDEFLRCVEYGSGLNFTFMAEDGKVLQDTYHSSLFGANYSVWAEDAAEIITQYQQNMAGLNQQRIVYHEQLSDYVTVTGYEDGTKVYVNYGTENCTENGVKIEARNYVVERGK